MSILIWVANNAAWISLIAAAIAVAIKFEHQLPKRLHRFLIALSVFISVAAPLLGLLKKHLDDQWKSEMTKRIVAAEAATKPRPIRIRLRELFSTIDPKIIPALRQGQRQFEGGITASQFNALQTAAREPGAEQFVFVDPDVRMGVGMGPEGVTYGVKFTIDPKVLSDEAQ